MSKKIDHLEIYLRYYSFKRTLIIVIIIAVVFLLLGVWGNDFIKDISRNMLKLWIIMCALAFIFSYPVLFSIRDKKENDITKLKGKKILFDSSHIAVSEHGYGGIDFPNVKDDENSYYDPNIDDDTLSFDRYKIIIKSDNGKKIRLYAFYTVEKAEIIRRFVKLLNRQGNKYPIEFTYYTHGRILIDVNLVDGVEYPERFISFFNEMKARL